MKISEFLTDKKILIWGYGQEGKSTENYINSNNIVCDYEIFEGSEDDIDFTKYELVIKSPGIKVSHKRDNVTSQTELFLMEFKNQTIGITGTKGKSTTTALTYHVLKSLGKKCIMVGNIGLPSFDYINDITKDTLIISEMSAHQLNNIHYSPHIAVFLNLYEEHLDFYETLDSYFKAKSYIALNQTKNDYLIVGENVPNINTNALKHIIYMDSCTNINLQILGQHNIYNANFVLYIANDILRFDKTEVLRCIETFKGLEHRLEYVGRFKEIDFYNDSISTIPQATINAIESVDNIETVIIGGMDRGIDYSPLVDYINDNENYKYILMSDSGKRILDDTINKKSCFFAKNLKEAVEVGFDITGKGRACVLSPAAASYNEFKNFEERGRKFKDLVKNYV